MVAFCRSRSSLLFFIVLRIAFSTSEESCEKVDVCTCKFSNGSTVSLKKADGGKAGASFTGIDGKESRKFDWNPCTPFTESSTTTAGCNDVMVCQQAGSDRNPAGSKDTSFSVDSSGNVVILYGKITDSASTPHTRETKITLKCDPKGTGKGTVDKAGFSEDKLSSSTSRYIGTLTSQYACAVGGSSSSSGGLSVGSILLIIFFPLVLMYVIIGVLVNRYGRGIENMPELLPNHSFWADFPFLVKDGIVFTGGCIKAGCSSLSNKFKKDGYAEI